VVPEKGTHPLLYYGFLCTSTKKIVQSELMKIRISPKDAVENIVERVIVVRQEKGSGERVPDLVEG
jgi:hypothetical protein